MIGNTVRVVNLIDLYQILPEAIYLSGKKSKVYIQKEIYTNAWGIILDDTIIPYITSDDLAKFFLDLIDARTEQVSKIRPLKMATLYIWFDEMALQLCFNVLSGGNRDLPFGCKLNVLDSPYPIFKRFLNVARNNLVFGNYLEITKIIEKGDPEFDNNDYDDFIAKNFTVDVWKITLPWNDKVL